MKFPGMVDGGSFQGRAVRFVDIAAFQYGGDMQQFYRELERRMGQLSGTDTELGVLSVMVSLAKGDALYNPIDVGQDLTVLRGNQRLCALRALGYQGKVPCRVFANAADLPPYHVPDGGYGLVSDRVGIFPKGHVRGAHVVRFPDGLRTIPPNGSLVVTREEYYLVQDQIPTKDYYVVMA